MLDILSTAHAIFPSLDEDQATPSVEALIDIRSRRGRDPVFSVETLTEGRSAYAAVFEDATPFLRRLSLRRRYLRSAELPRDAEAMPMRPTSGRALADDGGARPTLGE